MATQSIGTVSDSTPILFNKIPFIEIEYPIPYKVKDYEKKNVELTSQDTIKKGLNFYEIVTEIRLKDSVSEQMNYSEESELVRLLMGGVIYNGS